MVRRFAPRFTVWLALSAALACGRRGVPVTARDELVVATPGDPDSSGVVSGLGLHPVNANVYETLVRLTPDFRVAPQLATRWQLRSPNTWRFHLRQGVRMHDGTTLTAAAVVWTMRRIARAGGGPMGIGQSSARVIDDTTLDITPTRPGRRLIEQLANPDWSIMAPGSDSAARPVGTGPFRLVEYARGDHLTVERFDQYWGDRARLRRLTFRFLADANARLLALRAGDVQVASDLPREAARAARMLPDIAVATSPVGGYEALYVTEQSAAIRRAIIYALDRPRLVEAAWRGTAEPAQLLGPAVLLGRSADLVAGARSDPRRARRLLDGAGWTPLPDGIRAKAGRRLAVTLVIGPPDVDIHRVMATVVQDQLRDAGIDLRIVQLADSAAYRARIRSGAGDLWTVGGDLNDADPCSVADLPVRGAARRFLDACRAAVALDDAQHSAARALRVLIDEQGVVVPLAGTYRVWGLRREVRGFVPHPSSPSQRWDRVSLATNRVSR